VYAEQGLGDVIHFIRYVKLLQADGATVFAVVQPELVPLLESMPGLRCFKPGADDVVADCHVALLDLPMHYGTTLAKPARAGAVPEDRRGQGGAVARTPEAVGRQTQGRHRLGRHRRCR
jgi:hypothetical protein